MKKFINKYSIVTLCCIIMEQGLVAASTYIITKLGQSILSGEKLVLWLLLFVASLTFVFVPRVGTNLFLTKSKYYTFQKFVKLYEENFSNRPHLFGNQRFTKERQPYFTNQLWIEINEGYNFFLDFFSTLLNIVFNIGVIVLVINSYMILGYAMSLVVVYTSLMLTRKKISRMSIEAQNSQAKQSESLISGWDTILIGNKYNKNIWNTSFHDRVSYATKKNTQLNYFSGMTSLATIVVSLIPLLGVILWTLFQNMGDKASLMALAVTLPRQVNIIQYMGILIDYAVQAFGVLSKIRNIERNSELPEEMEEYSGKISWDKLNVFIEEQALDVHSLKELQGELAKRHSCRITIRGQNGSGKSTLLKYIKLIMSDEAFYFPASSKLFFQITCEHEYSTGQRIVTEIQDVVNNANVSVILLDEWDANLDEANIEKLSALIDTISKTKTVIEVRHRAQNLK